MPNPKKKFIYTPTAHAAETRVREAGALSWFIKITAKKFPEQMQAQQTTKWSSPL